MRYLFLLSALAFLLPAEPRDSLADLLAQGRQLAGVGRFEESERMVRTVLAEAGDVAEERAIAWNDLGFIQLHRGELLNANASLRNSVLLWEKLGQGDSIVITVPLVNLGSVQLRLTRYAVAERHLHRALEIRIRELGPDHTAVANLYNSLGEVYRKQGRNSEAENSFRNAIAIWGGQNRDPARLAAAWNNLALLLSGQGRVEESVDLLERAVQVWKRLGHSNYWMGLGNLAAAYAEIGMYKKAELAYRASLAGIRSVDSHRAFGQLMMNFSQFLSDGGRDDEALDLRRRAQSLLMDHRRANALDHTVDLRDLRQEP